MPPFNRVLHATLLLFLTLIVACNDGQGDSGSLTKVPDNYKTYEENGISLAYPGYWSLSYDTSPSIYTSRGIGLNISEFSTATVLIAEDRDLALDYVTNRFLKEFQVHEKDTIDNFNQHSETIGKFSAETATWDDRFRGNTQYELTVSKVQNEPSDVFVIFSLSDEDIGKVQEHKERFLNSIHIQGSK